MSSSITCYHLFCLIFHHIPLFQISFSHNVSRETILLYLLYTIFLLSFTFSRLDIFLFFRRSLNPCFPFPFQSRFNPFSHFPVFPYLTIYHLPSSTLSSFPTFPHITIISICYHIPNHITP